MVKCCQELTFLKLKSASTISQKMSNQSLERSPSGTSPMVEQFCRSSFLFSVICIAKTRYLQASLSSLDYSIFSFLCIVSSTLLMSCFYCCCWLALLPAPPLLPPPVSFSVFSLARSALAWSSMGSIYLYPMRGMYSRRSRETSAISMKISSIKRSFSRKRHSPRPIIIVSIFSNCFLASSRCWMNFSLRFCEKLGTSIKYLLRHRSRCGLRNANFLYFKAAWRISSSWLPFYSQQRWMYASYTPNTLFSNLNLWYLANMYCNSMRKETGIM